MSRAAEHFRKGIELYNDEKWQEAEAAFEAAWAQSRVYDIAALLGHTEFRLRKPDEAAEHLTFAVRNWSVGGKAELRSRAVKRLAEAKAQVGALSIRASVEGAVILIDGKEIGKSPLSSEVFVMPGSHTIKAELADHEPAHAVVKIDEGGSREVSLKLHRKEKGKSAALIVAGSSVSLVVVGVGVGLLLAARDRGAEADITGKGFASWICNSNVDPSAVDKLPDCGSIKDARKDQFMLENIATGAFIAGGAIGVSTVVYALWPSAKPVQRMGVQVRPVITSSDGGLWVSGRF